jgi:transcriptional regulator with XRE-family HTH domain
LANPDVQAAAYAILDEMLSARKEAGFTQAQVAERMGTQDPAVARLDSWL